MGDDLVQHYRNWPGRHYVYIDVERCLRDVPWRLEDCVPLVTSKGLERKASLRQESPFNERGFLQLSLFGCPPFRGLTEREVRDVPTKERRVAHKWQIYPCPMRPRLFDDLIMALSTYNAARQTSDTWPALAELLHQGGVACQQIEPRLRELRRRQIPLTNQALRHRSTASLIQMVQGTADLFATFEAADYYHTGGSASTHVITRFLLWWMADAFRTHVPRFPKVAIYHALATILEPLGIDNERGEPWTAAGIKGLFRRHSAVAIAKDYVRHGRQWIREIEEISGS
jgi:hypothetical protein